MIVIGTITYCDLIVVLQDGAIAEQGDHKSLLSQQGLYFNLWQKQIRAEEASDPITSQQLKGEADAAMMDAARSNAATPDVVIAGPSDHHHA